MQSHCIYAEAFAGPFRPLRAPEPPFTHKTPPFTQVLFLFDAFYGTISLRKSSSLCSYKTESEVSMKKRILALLLAFSMMLSLLPVSALADTGGGIDFAAYASNGSLPDLVMDNDTGKPDLSRATQISERVYQGNGWKYDKNSDALTLTSGKYDFNYTVPRFSDSKHYDNCDHLNCVNVNHIVVQPDATIVGGNFWEQSLSNYGTVTNGLFKGTSVTNHGTLNCLFPPNSDNSKPTGIGTIECHSLTAADNSTVEVLLYSSTFGNTTTTYSEGTFYFTGTPTLEVKLSSNEEITCINGEKLYGGLTKPDWKGYQTFTPKAGEDVVLNQEPYVTDLAISNGMPDLSRANQPSEFVFQGNGWKYEIDSHTLTLESGEYNFSNSKDGLGQLDPDVKLVVGAGAKLTGGAFNEIPHGLTADNVQPIILNGSGLNGSGSIEAVNGLSSQKWSKKLYAIKDSQVEIKASVPLADINCRVIDPHYYPDSRDKTTLLFTINGDFIYSYTKLGETELTLNKSTRTNLIMLDNGCPNLEGVPYNWDSMYTYTGDGWKYVFNNSGSLRLNDTSSYNFRYLDPLSKNGNKLAAVTCGIINSGATIEDGVFKNLVINHSGIISGGTFAVGLFSIDSEDFSTSGTVTGGAFNGKDGLSDGAHAVTVNGGSIRKVNDTEPLVLDSSHNLTTGTEWNLYSYEGTIVTVTADTDITNINGWNIGRFRGSSYPNGEDDKKTVSFQMPDGPVVLNDTLYTLDIIRGTMWGNTSVAVPAGTELPLVADKPAKNETFLGWRLSDESLLKDGTLNDPECTRITIKMKAASATAEAVFQKDTPAYTLTVTGGGLVNDKTSAVVEAGDEVCLTVGEMQDGMSFNYWDLPTALIKALTAEDSNFSNKVEPLTFTMPDLSGYTEDTRFTIRLDIRPAELPDDDDGPSVLGTMATVAVGGAAAGILVWQGMSLGVDSYLQLSLPGGVPVPANRIELVKLLWETAGKPDVVLPALYGDVSAEDGELQKATRWAIDNGLVKSADEGDASRFDPDRSVSKYEVARAWFKVQQMLK